MEKRKQVLPKKGRILGLDWGAKHVGVAVSDTRQQMVSVRAVVRGGEAEQFEQLGAMVRADAVVGVLVGLPLNMDGSAGESAGRTRSWAGRLKVALGVPVVLWDERLSSRQAENAFFEQRLGRKTRGSKLGSVGLTDSGAAAVVLESYLCYINNLDGDLAEELLGSERGEA